MSRSREFFQAMRDMLPLLVGAMPFGIIYGTLAASAGLSAAQAMGMSLLVFAGSAQFIALSLLSGGAGMAVVLLTTLVVNLRHALYSATLQPFVRHLPARWRVPLAFWLTDEAFAVVQQRYAAPDTAAYKHWYFFGAALAMYLNWQLCTLIGVLFGQTFIGVVVPMLRNWPQVAAALVAGAVALACHGLPYKLGLLAAAVSGIAIGLYLERRQGLQVVEEVV